MPMSSNRPYLVRACYEWIVDNHCTPYILVDASQKAVIVPSHYVKDGQIVLNISPAAVKMLDMNNEAITCEGRFGGKVTTLFVPMAALMAIYAKENGQGMVFSTGQPQQEQWASSREPTQLSAKRPHTRKSSKPHLRLVK